MIIAIIGVAGVRTPLIVQAILARQDRLGINEPRLMDIDGERLELTGSLTSPVERSTHKKISYRRLIDASH